MDPNKIIDPVKIINKFGLKSFGGPKDLDWDGIPNKIDCQPRNTFRQDKLKRNVVSINSGRGIQINKPDGLEIQILQDRPKEFKEYAKEIALSIGLEPRDKINCTLGTKPSRIIVTW